MNRSLRLLLITNLFPNPVDLNRGIFVNQLVKELRKLCDVEVVCPLPWFPKIHPVKALQRWQQYSLIPNTYVIDGITVHSPKYPMIPFVSDPIHSVLMYMGLVRCTRKLHRQHAFDVINAQWLYPDGVVSSWLAKMLKIPVALTALGCDVNLFLDQPTKRLQILPVLRRANAITVVSKSLAERLEAEGIPSSQISVIPNGVNTELFVPRDRAACSEQLRIPVDSKKIVFVGRLDEEKGVEYLVTACRQLSALRSDYHVYLVGDGPLRTSLETRVVDEGLAGCVTFLGMKSHAEVALWIGACDVFCLPSIREGCPNVVLESLASGRPVVASAVGGVPEVLSGDTGFLVRPEDPNELARALHQALDRQWNTQGIVDSISAATWENAAKAYYSVLSSVLQRP